MGLHPTASYLQTYSATWVTSLSIPGVPNTLLATTVFHGFQVLHLFSIRGLITSTFHGIFRSQVNDYQISSFSSLCLCDFRYSDAVDSYTQISLFHRTRDWWYFQGLIQSPTKP